MLRAPAQATRAPTARWKLLLRDGAIALALVIGISFFQTRGHLSGAAPTFSLPLLGGGSVDSAQLKGKPTLLAFWAPWCGVCKTTSTNVGWTQKLIGDRGRVLSVASAFEDVSQVQKYVADRGVDYPVLLDDEGMARAFQVNAYPTFYFLDENGRIKASAVGYTTTLGLLARLWW